MKCMLFASIVYRIGLNAFRLFYRAKPINKIYRVISSNGSSRHILCVRRSICVCIDRKTLAGSTLTRQFVLYLFHNSANQTVWANMPMHGQPFLHCRRSMSLALLHCFWSIQIVCVYVPQSDIQFICISYFYWILPTLLFKNLMCVCVFMLLLCVCCAPKYYFHNFMKCFNLSANLREIKRFSPKYYKIILLCYLTCLLYRLRRQHNVRCTCVRSHARTHKPIAIISHPTDRFACQPTTTYTANGLRRAIWLWIKK